MRGKCILLATDARIPFRQKLAFFEKKALGRRMRNDLSVAPGSWESKNMRVTWSWAAESAPLAESHNNKSPETWNAGQMWKQGLGGPRHVRDRKHVWKDRSSWSSTQLMGQSCMFINCGLENQGTLMRHLRDQRKGLLLSPSCLSGYIHSSLLMVA